MPRKKDIQDVIDAAMRELGSRGGKRRAQTMTAEQLREIGRKGAAARWQKREQPDK